MNTDSPVLTNQATANTVPANRVNVTHEWGRLKEVIVGRADTVRLPDLTGLDPAFLNAKFTWATDVLRGQLSSCRGQPWREVNPETAGRAEEQMENLVRFLQTRGIVVHRPRPLTEEEEGFLKEYGTFSNQLFPRDSVLVVGNHVIEVSMRMVTRAKENFGLRDLFLRLAAERDCHYVSMPFNLPSGAFEPPRDTGPMLEGGDVAVLGHDILVGINRTTKSATNDGGIRWLQQYLGDAYRVQPVPLTKDILHLDDGFAAVREGLAIIMPEQFAEGLPPLLRDWEFVEVSKWEALNYLAGNGLVLGPNEILIDDRLPHVAEALARHGVTVHTITYDAITPWSGGLRCSHHPIVRELD